MSMKRSILFLCIAYLLIGCQRQAETAVEAAEPSFHKEHKNTVPTAILDKHGVAHDTSTLLIINIRDQQIILSNPSRLNTQFSPASTSKIPHTLIALEEGIAKADTQFKWDGTERWVAGWNQDQTLKTAFQRSAVWVYQDIARQAGPATMRQWLEIFEYGNKDIGGEANIDQYWLTGPLAISAEQQVQFLTNLHAQTFPLKRETYEAARDIMLEEEGEGWQLFAKTGWYFNEKEMDIGWYVGWVERGDDVFIFAFNMDMPNGREDAPKRKALMYDVLRDIGALPAAAPTASSR